MREARIDPAQWLKDQYARSREDVDLLRYATVRVQTLSGQKIDELRQTQLEAGEIVRVLGHALGFTLAMKFDRTIGWVQQTALEPAPSVKKFPPVNGPFKKSAEFLNSWQGTPYVWGGWTRKGIDCSGFTQRYFLEVRGLVIPKHSRDQRKAGRPKDQPGDEDLVFCHPRAKGPGVHHVALYYDRAVWHARLDKGVVRQTWTEFEADFQVEEVVSVCDNS